MWPFSTRKRRPATPGRQPRSHQPRLETLEARCLLSSGPLDPTFGSGGTVTTAIGTGADASAVAIQADGKILAAGNSNTRSAAGARFTVARYTPSGSLDTNFGSGGIVTTQVGTGTSAGVSAMLVQGDGKIVLAGTASFKKGSPGPFALVRYTASGSLDSSFGSGGIVATSFPATSTEVIQPDGKIVVAGGDGSTAWALARYNANGTLDTSFGSGGEVWTIPAGYPSVGGIAGMALQGDGKIVVATGLGTGSGPGSQQFTVARYNANGTLDTSFGTAGTGIVVAPGVPGGHQEEATSVVIQSDGKIVATGWTWLSSQGECVTRRFNPDGSLDTTFGSGGAATTVLGGSSEAFGVALQSDGKIVVAADTPEIRYGDPTGNSVGVARYNIDGSLDTTFNGTGTFTTQIGSGTNGHGMVLQPADGKIVLVGSASVGGVSEFGLARVLAADPQIGSFAASANPVPSGTSETFTVSNLTDANPSATITQVTFYYIDGTGTRQTLGSATQTSPGVWTLTFTITLAPGSYTIYAQAQDNYNLFSDPFALPLTVQ
jgi:uncharacterized delta-60 repeat protein